MPSAVAVAGMAAAGADADDGASDDSAHVSAADGLQAPGARAARWWLRLIDGTNSKAIDFMVRSSC